MDYKGEASDGFHEEDGYYEPSDEEKREMEDILKQEDEKKKLEKKHGKNRLTFAFLTESHWEGWLKINNIIWNK